ncbi:Diaminohydroxyphosphoribosylaminopyrimidine deaminase / 5-amino-6-(5-phosphoribosylamino)uracil reductase [hydrothermal vent metagenome]|uniref:Diaminohydroxyphosphoribosylaminopyrimidine deaminase / 5-amino-6-(5-phosphoribosylamino)uracil reductase n=1 Tax=hydrothermal vent metagenome TaxID=652676 RepID=A0A3B0YN80_9ZZZZ
MAAAMHLAERGLYSTSPNPNVGCIIVNAGEIVGRGWHACAGGPHAEVHALREAGEKARGADVFVTLEPCSHHGRTPPCADALVSAGVSRVVLATQDPNPQVAGSGGERLQAAGIKVEIGLMQAQAQALNPGFMMRMQQGRPRVRLKLASSLDGRTAMASGESRWITGDAARHDVQHLRARSSAIVTGIDTVLADDPSMNVRLDAQQLNGVEPVRQPLRVVLDTQLRMPVTAKMLSLPGETLVLTGNADTGAQAILQETGALVERVDVQAGRLVLTAVLECLAQHEVNDILLECGATLAGAFMRAGLVDELVLYLAPHLMGDTGRGLFSLPGLEKMQSRVELEWVDVRQVGADLKVTLAPHNSTIA